MQVGKGSYLFTGGFLGMDNISAVDRSFHLKQKHPLIQVPIFLSLYAKEGIQSNFVYLYFVWINITGWCNRLDGILCPLHVRNSTGIVLGTRCRPQILQSLWRIPGEVHINIRGHEQEHWQRRYKLVIHITGIFEHFQVNVAIYEHCVKE